MAGYWNKIDPAVACHIDTNDRFNFSDDDQPKPDKETLDRQWNGVNFYVCERGGRNRFFVNYDKNRGIYFNDRIVFTNEELSKFDWKTIEFNDDDQKPNESDDPVISLDDYTIFTISELNKLLDSCFILTRRPKSINWVISCSIQGTYSSTEPENSEETTEEAEDETDNSEDETDNSEDETDNSEDETDNSEDEPENLQYDIGSLFMKNNVVFFDGKIIFTEDELNNIRQRLNEISLTLLNKSGSPSVHYSMHSIVFTYNQLLNYIKRIVNKSHTIFTNKDIDTIRAYVETQISQNKFNRRWPCLCPSCTQGNEWKRKYPKCHFLHAYVTFPTEFELCKKEKHDSHLIMKENGIEFKEGDEIIRVGLEGAHVSFDIPITE